MWMRRQFPQEQFSENNIWSVCDPISCPNLYDTSAVVVTFEQFDYSTQRPLDNQHIIVPLSIPNRQY